MDPLATLNADELGLLGVRVVLPDTQAAEVVHIDHQ
jgi:hypothetical protein